MRLKYSVQRDDRLLSTENLLKSKNFLLQCNRKVIAIGPRRQRNVLLEILILEIAVLSELSSYINEHKYAMILFFASLVCILIHPLLDILCN